eukprot:403350927
MNKINNDFEINIDLRDLSEKAEFMNKLRQLQNFLLLEVINQNSTIAGQLSDKLFRFTVSRATSKGCTVLLTFPSLWFDTTRTALQQPLIDESKFKLSKPDGSSLTYVFNKTVWTVNITGLFSDNLSRGQSMSFIVKGVKNPIATSIPSSRLVNIKVVNEQGMIVDSGDFQVTAQNPTNIPYATIIVADKTVQAVTSYNIQFNVSQPVKNGCRIDVQFPSADFNLTTNPISYIEIGGALGILQNVTYTVSGSTLTLTNACKLDFGPSATDLALIFIRGVKNPKSIKPTDAFTLALYDVQNGQIAITPVVTGSLSVTAITGIVTSGNLNVPPEGQSINSITWFRVEFKAQHSQLAGQDFRLIVAIQNSNYQIQSQGTVSVRNSNIANIGQSVIAATGQQVQFDVSGSSLTADQLYFIEINFIKVAGSLVNLNSFSVDVLAKVATSYYKVDSGIFQADFIIPKVGTLKQLKVTTSSTRAADITSISVQFVNSNPIPVRGYILIQHAPEIYIPSSSTIECLNGATKIACTYTASSRQVKVTGLTATSQLNADSNTIITINNMRMPRSVSDTSQKFQFQTYNQQNNPIETTDAMDDSLNDSILRMAFPSIFKSFTLTSSSYIVGAKSSIYTMTINTPSDLISGDLLYITMPSDIQLPSITKCASSVLQSIQCDRINTQVVKINMQFTNSKLDSGKNIDVQISGFINKESGQPSQSFQAQMIQSDNTTQISQSNTSVITNIAMTTPSPITQGVSIANNTPNYPGYITNLTITFQNSYIMKSGTTIQIKYANDQEPALANVKITLKNSIITRVGKVAQDINNNLLKISDIITSDVPANTLNTVQIEGLVNSQSSTFSQSLVIDTFTSDNYILERVSSGLVIKPKCNYPCADCVSTSTPTQCSKCIPYSMAHPYAYLQGNICAQVCNDGYYVSSNDPAQSQTCQKCSSLCKTCKNSASFCTSCDQRSDYTALYLNNCTGLCPDGLFKNKTTGLCQTCNSTCKTCSESATNCTSCYSYSYQWNGTCSQTCPAGISIPNATSWQCMKCDSRCATCSNAINKCTTCITGLRLNPFTSYCDKYCPDGVTVESSPGVCSQCHYSCFNCTKNVTQCTSCKSGYIPGPNNTCLDQCGEGMVVQNGTCAVCSPECKSCTKSPDFCTSCSYGFIKYQDKCMISCPNGMIFDKNLTTCVDRICPSGFLPDKVDGNTCVSISSLLQYCGEGKIYNEYFDKCLDEADVGFWYFPILVFLLATSLIWLLFIQFKCNNETNKLQTIICWWSLFEPFIYGAQIYVCWRFDHWIVFWIIVGALVVFYVINITSIVIFAKCKNDDLLFKKWSRKKYPHSYRTILFFSVLLNQKLLRLFTCSLWDYKPFQAEFKNHYVFYASHLRKFAYVIIAIVYNAILVADIFILLTMNWPYYIFQIGIETLVYISLMTLMMFVEYRLLRQKFTFIVKVVPRKNQSAEKIQNNIEEIHGPLDEEDIKKILATKNSNKNNEKVGLLTEKEKENSKNHNIKSMISKEKDNFNHQSLNSNRQNLSNRNHEKPTDDPRNGPGRFGFDSNMPSKTTSIRRPQESNGSNQTSPFKDRFGGSGLQPMNLNSQLQFYSGHAESSQQNDQDQHEPNIEVIEDSEDSHRGLNLMGRFSGNDASNRDQRLDIRDLSQNHNRSSLLGNSTLDQTAIPHNNNQKQHQQNLNGSVIPRLNLPSIEEEQKEMLSPMSAQNIKVKKNKKIMKPQNNNKSHQLLNDSQNSGSQSSNVGSSQNNINPIEKSLQRTESQGGNTFPNRFPIEAQNSQFQFQPPFIQPPNLEDIFHDESVQIQFKPRNGKDGNKRKLAKKGKKGVDNYQKIDEEFNNMDGDVDQQQFRGSVSNNFMNDRDHTDS